MQKRFRNDIFEMLHSSDITSDKPFKNRLVKYSENNNISMQEIREILVDLFQENDVNVFMYAMKCDRNNIHDFLKRFVKRSKTAISWAKEIGHENYMFETVINEIILCLETDMYIVPADLAYKWCSSMGYDRMLHIKETFKQYDSKAIMKLNEEFENSPKYTPIPID